MEFEKNIVNYLESKQSAEWSLIGVLRYLAENMEYTSESIEEIVDIFKRHLIGKSNDDNVKKAARNKANKLCKSLKQTLTRTDINEFLDQQDVKFAKVC